MQKLALARALPYMGRSLGMLGAMGGLGYTTWQTGKALKSFNPQNPGSVGQSIMGLPQKLNQHNRDTNEVIDWANTPRGASAPTGL